MSGTDHLRCSDNDRQGVEQLLANAFADGRITHDEYDERLTALWQSKTFLDLKQLTDDLVPERQFPAPIAPMSGEGHPSPVIDRVGADPTSDRILSIMSSHRRLTDQWRFRRYSNITVLMGEAQLDLTKAIFEDDQCEINVLVVMGSVELTIPAGVAVHDETAQIMGDSKVLGLLPSKGGPEITIKGAIVMGDLKIDGPSSKRRRKKKT